MRIRAIQAAQSGFTLIEVMIAASLLAVVGLGLTQGLDLAQGSHVTVTNTADDNRDMRESFKLMREELKSSRDSLINVAQDVDVNAVVRFQVPIEGAGVAAWGAFERRLGSTSADWNRADWEVTYSVEPDMTGTEVLYRRLLDSAGTQQFEEILASNVRPGTHADGPGFVMEQVGDVWVMTLTLIEQEGNGIRSETMHVRTRN